MVLDMAWLVGVLVRRRLGPGGNPINMGGRPSTCLGAPHGVLVADQSPLLWLILGHLAADQCKHKNRLVNIEHSSRCGARDAKLSPQGSNDRLPAVKYGPRLLKIAVF